MILNKTHPIVKSWKYEEDFIDDEDQMEEVSRSKHQDLLCSRIDILKEKCILLYGPTMET